MLKKFIYKFDDGPFNSINELEDVWCTGNCRRAVQYYLWHEKKAFLKPNQIFCPYAFYSIGVFVYREGQQLNIDQLINGDIIYAERIANMDGSVVDKSEKYFSLKDEYIISLHTALFTEQKNREIWHATQIEGKSCFWSLEKFLACYRVIAVKRVGKK